MAATATAAVSFSSSSSATAAAEPVRTYASAAAGAPPAVVVLPAQPPAQRVPYFTAADAFQSEDCYVAVQAAANALFDTCDMGNYAQMPGTMSGYIQDWTATQSSADESELAARIEIIVICDNQRTEAIQSLKKVSDAFARAITYCTPPVLDPTTITHLKKMKVPVDIIESNYSVIFIKNVEAMQKSKREVDVLLKTIDDTYHRAKRAIEPTAYRLKAGTFGALSYGRSWGGTPYVDAARDAYRAAHKAKPPVDSSDNKEEI